MPGADTERRLAAIMVADVCGYSRLMGEDEAGTLAAVTGEFDGHIGPLIDDYHGRVVKTLGDGILAEFASAVDSVQCAVAIQRGMAERHPDASDNRRLQLRLGINLGDIIVRDGDVFGDGVNIAARLEGVAQPGGIAVSASIHEQVKGKLAQAFNDMGPQKVKNIADPVQAFSVVIDGAGTLTAPNPVAEKELPSVVVLPLDNMSEDTAQDSFADGITEDVITELSRFPDLFVIARNSAFSYKGRPTKVQDIARDLGVRYVVEGSVRRSGDRVRVTVQLIDATTGSHVHADKYDRDLTDIFEVQDDITSSIVASLPGHLRSAEAERVRRKPTEDLAAYDCLLKGRIHHHRATPEDNELALDLLDRAIELDPEYGAAYAWKACVLGQALQFGFGDDIPLMEEQAVTNVNRALAIDENDVECHRLLCEVHMYYHKIDKAVPHAERALALNPNDPRIVAQRGEVLMWQGAAEEGVDWIEKANRLDPFGASGRAHLLGRALFGAGRYPEAAKAYRSMHAPTCGQKAELAAVLALSDRPTEAAELVGELGSDCPDFAAGAYVARLAYEDSEDRQRLHEAMVAVGLPD